MNRKIIQIANTTIKFVEHKKTFCGGEPYDDEIVCQNVLTALCDDGSVWYFHENDWHRLKDLPAGFG